MPDHHFAEFDETGFSLIPGFLTDDELAAARAGLWTLFPRPEEYFADPASFAHLQGHGFAGLRGFPFASFELNRLCVHEALVAVAARILDTPDVRLYKSEVWAKYGGGVDYAQTHHRDYGNHTLVVPRADRYRPSLTTYIYLGDVDERNGSTAVVPLEHSRDIPMGTRRKEPGAFADVEQRLNGPAGSLAIYSTDVFHRATSFTDQTASRFMMLIDFRRADAPWIQKQAFGNTGNSAAMVEFISRSTPAQRTLLDIPPPGHEFWNAESIEGMAQRYPGIDMSAYSEASTT